MTTTSTSCAAVVVRAPGRRAGCTASTSGGVGGAAVAPLAGSRLGIDVEHNGGPAGLLDSDGKGEGRAWFTRSRLFAR